MGNKGLHTAEDADRSVGTAGGSAEHGQPRLERSGPESSGACLSSTLKSLTKAGLNDQKFHLIGQIKK